MTDEQIVATIERLLAGCDHRLRVLDIGAGRRSRIVPDGCWLAGTDISGDELALNERLDARFVSDAQTPVPPLGADAFDVVVVYDVLEHLERPQRALEAALEVLAPGGVLVVAAPNPRSLKGALTRWTPFWLHRLAVRVFLGDWAPDPFPTYLRAGMRQEAVRRWAAAHGLAVVDFAWQPEAAIQQRFRARLHLTGRAWRWLRRVWKSAGETDYRLILQRPAAAVPAAPQVEADPASSPG
jgi:SAM-dependent methyltransferase